MTEKGFPWAKQVQNLEHRAQATTRVLRPLVEQTMQRVLQAAHSLLGKSPHIPPGFISSAFCGIRLKPGTIGLTEPPTDRRAYTVLSIGPGASKDIEYLKQVILHECIHIGVGSNGGEPHNEEFNKMAEALGLAPEHRD
jgi:hypothetical protein